MDIKDFGIETNAYSFEIDSVLKYPLIDDMRFLIKDKIK